VPDFLSASAPSCLFADGYEHWWIVLAHNSSPIKVIDRPKKSCPLIP
jgi:hypothetical protein